MYRRLTLLFLSATLVCSAQHTHIPDATAYRVFFRAFTADSDPIRQQAMLLRARLSSTDFAAALQVGASFIALRNAYKAAEAQAIANAAASGVPIDQTALNGLRDAIGTTVKNLLTNTGTLLVPRRLPPSHHPHKYIHPNPSSTYSRTPAQSHSRPVP